LDGGTVGLALTGGEVYDKASMNPEKPETSEPQGG